jgi:hypothetical protein
VISRDFLVISRDLRVHLHMHLPAKARMQQPWPLDASEIDRIPSITSPLPKKPCTGQTHLKVVNLHPKAVNLQ